MSTFLRTIESYRQGSRTLPRRYYTSADVFVEETERIMSRQWLCVGRASEIAEPGDYVLRRIAGESLIVLRDHDRTPRALFNVCRHRGTRLCEAPQGHLSETIQCPYHAWTYRLDGRLIGAPHMQDVEGFDKRDYPLHAAAIHQWEGFLFVNLDRGAPPFEAALAPLIGRFDRFGLSTLRIGHRVEYDVAANWKLVAQNYSECLHCPMIHPELSLKLPYTSGENDVVEGPVLGGFMLIAEPHESATVSGRLCAPRLSGLDAEQRRAYYYTVFPTLMLSIHPDYAVYYILWPVDAARTRIESGWLFRPEAFEGAPRGFADAIDFWERTNRQDWHICEASQLGVSSRVYTPGPYSARESVPAAWDREYLRVMGHSTPRA